jgi:nitrogen fixation NifU-like protein
MSLDRQVAAALVGHHARARVGAGLVPESDAQELGLVVSQQRNRSCADEVTVQLGITGGIVTSYHWDGHGCLLSQASASMLAELVPGMAASDIPALVSRFRQMIRTHEAPVDGVEAMGDALALLDAGRLPVRGTCTLLAWHALEDALSETPTPMRARLAS